MKGVASVLAALMCFAAHAGAQGTFHGDAARTGAYPGPGPAQLHGVKWSFDTGGPVFASPVPVGDTVYISSASGSLFALDRDTGREKWLFQAGEDPALHNQVGFQSSAAVAGGIVFVGCRDAHVCALDARSGRKLWDYPASKSWVNGTPAVRDRCPPGRPRLEVPDGSLDGRLYALH